jgi:DNA mismatch repair protein MutS2
MNDLFKLVQIENAKQQKLTAKQKKILKDQHKKLSIEVAQKVSVIRKKRKTEKAKAALKPIKPKHIFSVGERVRLDDGKAVGIIDKLEKNKAIINYGMFTTSVNIDRLELVEGK